MKHSHLLKISGLLLCMLLAACSREEKVAAEGEKLLVVDVLDPADYANAHIKGSINVPLSDLEKTAAEWNKDTRIVVYCANYMCGASADAAQKLEALGFKNVAAYEGGSAEWHSKGYPIEGTQAKPLPSVGTKTEHPGVTVIEADALKSEMEAAGLLK